MIARVFSFLCLFARGQERRRCQKTNISHLLDIFYHFSTKNSLRLSRRRRLGHQSVRFWSPGGELARNARSFRLVVERKYHRKERDTHREREELNAFIFSPTTLSDGRNTTIARD